MPWSQEVEKLANEQRARRDGGEIQFWLPQDNWVESEARVPPTSKGSKGVTKKKASKKPSKKASSSKTTDEGTTSEPSRKRVLTVNELID